MVAQVTLDATKYGEGPSRASEIKLAHPFADIRRRAVLERSIRWR